MLYLKDLLPIIKGDFIIHKWNKEESKEVWYEKEVPEGCLNSIVESCILRHDALKTWYDINLQ